MIHSTEGSSLRGCLGEDVEAAVWRQIDAGTVATNYQRFAAAVAARRTIEPGFRRAAELQKVLDLAIETEKERRERKV